jgi:hypothetical protein
MNHLSDEACVAEEMASSVPRRTIAFVAKRSREELAH